MAYSVTFTLNSLYTGTTQANNFTIIGQHSGGSPSDTTIATNVTKTQLTAGVTYQVADTITGGTVTSTGDCTNTVNWTGLSNTPAPTPEPTSGGGDPEVNLRFNKCGNDGEAPENVIISGSNWSTLYGSASLPANGSTIRVDGNGVFVNSNVWTFDSSTPKAANHTAISIGDTCNEI
tara:strand:- start:478 stop:1008 length:531 start_codon:yes stop_codon:yes gene_type:complete